MKLEVKYLKGMEEYPLMKVPGNAGIDLYAAEDVTLFAGNHKMVGLGVSIKLPRGTAALLMPRSSTFKNWQCIFLNSVGLIDESYCGDGDEWKVNLYNIGEGPSFIKRGDRIAQLVLINDASYNCEIVEVESHNCPDRGGFGTSGRSRLIYDIYERPEDRVSEK